MAGVENDVSSRHARNFRQGLFQHPGLAGGELAGIQGDQKGALPPLHQQQRRHKQFIVHRVSKAGTNCVALKADTPFQEALAGRNGGPGEASAERGLVLLLWHTKIVIETNHAA